MRLTVIADMGNGVRFVLDEHSAVVMAPDGCQSMPLASFMRLLNDILLRRRAGRAS